MSKTIKYIKLCHGMTKFLLYPNLSMNKVANLPKYTSLYLHMMNNK